MTELKSYYVWDAFTRWFHWINVLSIVILMALGLAIVNGSALGLTNDGKILLKEIHVLVGYVFVLNLLWRFVWAFFGNRHARWGAILPVGKGFFQSVRNYISAFVMGKSEVYLGHNPLARIAVFVLFILMTVQAVTGLVLAGTDIFYPPFGGMIAQWVASPGIDPSTLVPYAKEMLDPEAYKSMRAFRAPFIEIHEINFFILSGVIFLHIAAVVITEIKEGGGIISAMVTGKKVFDKEPVDVDKE